MPSTASSSSSLSSQFPTNLPPLRSLDDFLLGSARFQLPNFRDLDKWGNRVIKNLLYYQTNYILLFVSIYTLMGILYPTKIFCGLFVKFIIIGIFIGFFSNDSTKTYVRHEQQHPTKNKWLYLGASLLIGYLLLLWYDAVLISAFTLLLPFGATFVHASLRLRNIKNKIVNEIMENFPANTPMGVFLESLNVACDKIVNQTESTFNIPLKKH